MSETIVTLNAALSGRYRIERELGAGGMATVYLAHDEKHNRLVAIKVLHSELGATLGADRFLAEIETTAKLSHPHILPLFDSGEAGGRLFYVMPVVEGQSLRDRLDRGAPLPVDEALSLTRDVAAALTYAHARGVVHRDIKPANILIEDGEALVADFGIARALSGADRAQLTATGIYVGTPAYMSPEQIGGESDVDGRADIYALACTLFEMLAGAPPFVGSTVQSVVAKALVEEAPYIRSVREDVPKTLDDALRRALAKRPEDRFPTALEFYEACVPTSPAPVSRRASVTTVLITLVLVGAVGTVGWRSLRVANSRNLLPEIARLTEQERYAEAYDLAARAERWIPGDSTLSGLLSEVSDLLTVESDPPGAQVFLQPFTDESDPPVDSQLVGSTPVVERRVPRVDHRVVVSMAGFAPVVRIASSALQRNDAAIDRRRVVVSATLRANDEVPVDRVAVPGGAYELVSPGAPVGRSAALTDFFIDRFEVSNEAFADFVTGGGYTTPSHWVDAQALPAALGGRPGPPGAVLVDRTGLPGPRNWSRQRFPDGAGRLPVTDVSWMEAAAYCRYVGKRLPTVYEWEKTARDGGTSRRGVLMPWGYVGSSDRTSARRANFNSEGPVAVEAYPFGISPYGAHAMAGNVREWTANPFGEGFAVTGGGWDGPSYLFTQYASVPGATTSPALGFRCARSSGAGDQGGGAIDLNLQPPTYTPVDEAGFQALLQHYRYDRRPARPRVVDVVETPSWVRQRVWIDGVGTDSVLLYFYAPKSVEPPWQTIVYVPGSSVFCCTSVPEEVEWSIGPAIQAGRAVLAVVMEGMRERPWSPPGPPTDPSSVRFRDVMVRHATELRLGIDYALTRGDVDEGRLAYLGVSWGGGSRLGFSAVDDRYAAVVYLGGGIDERVKPTLPEADNVNFAPYVRAPKLLLNGGSDEEHPWPTRGVALWNLLREPKDLVLIEGGGHIVPLGVRVPAVNDFLDRVLGPVGRP